MSERRHGCRRVEHLHLRVMSIRSRSLVSIVAMRACSSLCVVPLLALGCAGSDNTADQGSVAQTGALSLPLTAVGASGAVYRLRQGVFSVTEIATGTSTLLSTEQDPLASTLEASLPSGDYFVALQ